MFTCSHCENAINQATEICPYCGADLTEGIPGETEEPAGKRGLIKVLLASAALIAGLWAIVWFVMPHESGSSIKQAEATAVQSLRNVGQALASYEEAAGTFPDSLEEIGDKVRPVAQQAQLQGYQLVYTPGTPDADGRVHTYTLLARPANYGYRNFYADQTGVLRATRQNRPATIQDPPI